MIWKQARNTLLVAALTTAALGAQGGPPPGPPPGGPFGPGMGPGLGMSMPRLGPKLVTGAPYSADISNQSSQTLADGNTISRGTTGHVARDSQGRTYSQETFTGGMFGSEGPKTVTFITDPVAGYTYVLSADSKTAHRRALMTPPAGQGPRFPENSSRPNVTTADLGTQTINGVTATGKNVTHTIPAGAMGNAQPVVSTSETWYSADLQTIVLAKRNDPRFGTSTFALTNIQRGEPAASLFQVPSDYTVSDAKGPGGRAGRGHAGPPPGDAPPLP